MKEHWDLAERSLGVGQTSYIWCPPWPAIVLGLRSSVPLRVRSIHVGFQQIATDNYTLAESFPEQELGLLPHDVEEWRFQKKREVRLGNHVVVTLAEPARTPGTIELLLEPLPGKCISRQEQWLRAPTEDELREAQAKRIAKLAVKRERQLAECRLSLEQPYERKRYP